MSIKTDSENPLIGHVHRPNSSARLMNVMVNINSDGLRDREYAIQKGDKYRIIFLGDSLTLGWGVKQEDVFENLLEQEINKIYPTEIINFGTGNYNTEQEVNLFIEKGLKYKPDKAVLFYFINDAEKTPKKSTLWFLAHSRLLSFYWSRIHGAINNIVQSKTFNEYYVDLYRHDQIGWINTQKAFLQLKDVCRLNNIELQVVLLPELHNLKNYPFKKEYNLVASFLRNNDIAWLDLTPLFENYENSMELWVSLDDAHPNKLAHRMITEYALDFISDKK
ncbi:MAG: SGNH/GDSL hydrolase family protein [Nitrospirae bacterium]|nr:SGNH/GDSL hydrolase family protein [Nitrospirota bacterium]